MRERLDKRKIMKQTKKSLLWGVQIYDYSHEYMYEYGYSRVSSSDLLYSDTDSIKMTKQGYEQFMDNVKDVTVPYSEEFLLFMNNNRITEGCILDKIPGGFKVSGYFSV